MFAKRELKALALSPQTFAIGAAYLILSGVFFINILVTSHVPDLGGYYSNIANTMLVLVPVVAMRSFAEERRTGALDIQLAWPIPRASLVLGKFIVNSLYLWCLSSVVWLYYRLIGHFAHIQLSRTAGGYIGLLLMAMAFSALALMVSARASSPATAAFLGFGLLLFLWVLDYAPGWIGDSLAALGPTQHFDSFPKGVIYWDDVAYFVVVTLVGLGLAVAVLERSRPGQTLGSLLRRGASFGALLALLGGTIALAGDIRGQVDLTPTQLHTVTETTRDAIHKVAKLNAPLHITGFAGSLSQDAADIRALVKSYRSAGATIHLEMIDPDLEPGKAQQAGITGYGEAVVALGDRREVLTDTSQGPLTNVLLRLSRPFPPRICFTAGHGERDIADRSGSGTSTLAAALRYLGFEIKTLGLAAAGAAAELRDCVAVIVAGPQYDLLPVEVDLLSRFAQNNGRLMILADAFSQGPRSQLNRMLAPWDVAIGDAVVRDPSGLADDPSSVVSLDYGSGASPPVARLQEQGVPIVLTNALSIESPANAASNTTFTELIRSSSKSWREDQGTRRSGPFVLAALADSSRLEGTAEAPSVARTRIGVVGTVEVATNRMIDILGNQQFVTALVQWIAQDDDVVAAGRPPAGFTKLVLTGAQKNRLIRQGIVLPTLALLVPLPLAALRLRRG